MLPFHITRGVGALALLAWCPLRVDTARLAHSIHVSQSMSMGVLPDSLPVPLLPREVHVVLRLPHALKVP